MSIKTQIARAAAMTMVLTVAAVCAAPGASAGVLDELDPRDTSGVSITEYRLSFNNGATFLGAVFTPDTSIPAALAYVMFCVFMVSVWIGFTTLNLLPRTDWLTPLVRTIDAISTRLYAQLGVPFITMMISGLLMATTAIYVLRNKGNKAWHHIAMTLVCVFVGASIAFPVAEAAKMLGIGAQAATATGQAVAGAGESSTHNPTGVLVDEWVRKPVQRWTFGGQDMDSLGCGAAWTKAIQAHKPDEIKDAVLSCPGGDTGRRMHEAAMNPQDSMIDSGLTTVFGLLLGLVLVRIVLKLIGVSVAALIHAGLIKIGLIGVGTQAGQRFLVRNAVDAPVAAMTFFAGLLAIYVGADIAKILAQVVPSSREGMLLMIIMIVGALMGVKLAARSWNRLRHSAAAAGTGGGAAASGASSTLIRNQLPGGRALAVGAATRYTLRQARKVGTAVAAPEAAVPTAAVAKVRAAAQRAHSTGPGAASRAHNTAGGDRIVGGGPSVQTVEATAHSAAVVSPSATAPSASTSSHHARVAASRYRAQRGAQYPAAPLVAGRRRAPSGGAAGPRNDNRVLVASGRHGDPGTAEPIAAGALRRTGRTPPPAEPQSAKPPAPPAAPHPGGSVRGAGGTAEGARQVARGYFRNRGKP